ncbi:hypothetical protein WA026_006879 [Henosepilachna vigintioctopunctata]|uniref:Uncharacterized protein n=1 Tax=Henosepilachna vigintioctopunctata TaxID=420089 RepID=A0AAW1V4D9_9CUCU
MTYLLIPTRRHFSQGRNQNTMSLWGELLVPSFLQQLVKYATSAYFRLITNIVRERVEFDNFCEFQVPHELVIIHGISDISWKHIVVDSRARTDADGGLRQQARRQLEVFQSQVPGGRLQVVKTHSVSSSRWSNKRVEEVNGDGGGFEGLQVPSNPLDLSFQKFKAAVGRGAARRPPSRIKNKEDTSPTRQQILFNSAELAASTNLQRVTRLCHQIHDNAVKQAFGKYTNKTSTTDSQNLTRTNEIESRKHNDKSKEITYKNGHTNLVRAKSSSSEDFLTLSKDKSTKSTEDLEDLEHLQTWRRTSKIRRSLQNPKQDRASPNKPPDLPETSISVRKITEDFEKGRRLSTALRGNNIDLQALDQILQSISSSSSEKTSIADDDLDNTKKEVSKSKRNSFVTVESLQEIKGRLRRTSSPDKDLIHDLRPHEIDDGIVTEDSTSKSEDNMIELNNTNSQSRVRSYVYGMESLNKKPVTGTGSLESRSKLLNGTTNRSEDWYNRRKSYGFEPVQNQNESMSSKKNLVESSTDSGICRSSEVIVVPSVIKNNHKNCDEYDVDYDGVMSRLSSVELNKDSSFGKVKRISSLFDNKTSSFGIKRDQDVDSSWNKRLNKENEWRFNPGITIKIPIASNNHWNEEPEKDVKRHSIAVDETKYVSQNKISSEPRRTSLVINEKFLNAPVTLENGDHDFSAFNKKSKKVEFCKTEVHFAAESGKVNIVETDEKPPPTQNFRRRRRNNNSLNYLSEFNKNGLPVLHFGENYTEKSMFANGNQQFPDEGNSSEETEGGVPIGSSFSHGIVTVNSDFNNIGLFDDEKRESSENESIRGILKNKIAKPIPYHLGENPTNFNIFDDENHNWSSHRPMEKDPPVWKSTVTVRNTLFDKLRNGDDNTTSLKTFDSSNQPDIIKDQLKRLSEYQSDFRRVEPNDRVKSYFSVADRIKHMEESHKVDSHKGYSTRVNIGDGQAIVVENSTLSSGDIYLEPSRNETKEHKQILKKGLVVRIGRDDSSTQHMVCSKTTTNQNSSNTTTTTKITIDLSPTEDADQQPTLINAKCNGSHSFKSTSLILNTIKCQNEPEKLEKVPCQIPQQLEALKRLYDEENSDSDADKEVQLLTSRIAERELERLEDDNNSVVSGSWSRMRAYKNVYERANHKRTRDVSSVKSTLAQIEKESKIFHHSEAVRHQEEPVRIKAEIRNRKYSPIVLRKHPAIAKSVELKTASAPVSLSSPLLVSKRLTSDKIEVSHEKTSKLLENEVVERESANKKLTESNITDNNSKNSFIKSERVLRQPKTSELAYFGVQVPVQNHQEKDYFPRERKTNANITTKQTHVNKHSATSTKTEKTTKDINDSSISHIYENISPIPTKLEKSTTREFDSCILDELTKAADEILQAVKGYSEEEAKKQKEEEVKTELSTITENKSWKQEKNNKTVDRPCKSKLKNASSNSSWKLHQRMPSLLTGIYQTRKQVQIR